MPVKKRIIPCLDIKDGKVVKGINFADLADVGDPLEIAKRYEGQGADEIIFLDITAANENRSTTCELIERAAKDLSVPFTVGGGIRAADDFRKLFNCGAGKVSVNSAAVLRPELIREASQEFGSRRVVAAIDGKKVKGAYNVFIKGGRENTGLDLIEWAKKCAELGAGEILLTSMDADGMQCGYDIAMIKAVCDAVNIPVIASGGCGGISDIIDVFNQTGCDAALVASLFHYGKASVNDVKNEMERNGIPCVKSRD
ncbi:MAG: imidazole glycerol phosphate synthase subunit HisF [Defluviitaleaceae bacterium]|nr:imidazole glycerol phosphate synthase subunit HisF [Defluviitaleaceae bacterium]